MKDFLTSFVGWFLIIAGVLIGLVCVALAFRESVVWGMAAFVFCLSLVLAFIAPI